MSTENIKHNFIPEPVSQREILKVYKKLTMVQRSNFIRDATYYNRTDLVYLCKKKTFDHKNHLMSLLDLSSMIFLKGIHELIFLLPQVIMIA